MKRITAIHDISGIGKCSLTAAIPVISASGIECNPILTASLSTHTGEISGYTFRDLSDDMLPVAKHWRSLGITPDTIYTGYLGSYSQVETVKEILRILANDNTLIIVDPAMADSGKLYKGFARDFPEEMKSLCTSADVIVPNITEACLMTGTDYKNEYDREYILKLIYDLSCFTKRYVIMTGVSFENDKIGCAVFDGYDSSTEFIFSEKYPGTYYGTGDLFASVLASGMTKGFSCVKSASVALEFTRRAIRDTYNEQTDPRFGVSFENNLSYLIEEFGGNL